MIVMGTSLQDYLGLSTYYSRKKKRRHIFADIELLMPHHSAKSPQASALFLFDMAWDFQSHTAVIPAFLIPPCLPGLGHFCIAFPKAGTWTD